MGFIVLDVMVGVSLTQVNFNTISDPSLEPSPAPSTGPSPFRASRKQLPGHSGHPGTCESFVPTVGRLSL